MNSPAPLANGLYPIIHRARRPLVMAEVVPVGPTAQPPVAAPVEPSKPQSKPQGEADPKKESNDATAKI